MYPSAYRVWNARDDLPAPLTPTSAVIFPKGTARSMFFRLLVRMPLRMMLFSMAGWTRADYTMNAITDIGVRRKARGEG